jgi:small subunit ribosomal protein S20
VANTRSARKRIRQNEKRRLRNRAVRSAVRSTVKSAREALGGKAPEAASSETARLVREAIRALDRAVTQGIVHRNTAARRKSALARKLNAPA